MSLKALGNVLMWHGLLYAAIAGCYVGLFLYSCADAFMDFVGEHAEDLE